MKKNKFLLFDFDNCVKINLKEKVILIFIKQYPIIKSIKIKIAKKVGK
jgi:hypothetical protein